MTFRFFLQPIMASIAAWRDGIRNTPAGRLALSGRCSPIREKLAAELRGSVATSQIILLGTRHRRATTPSCSGTFHHGEAAIIAILLAFVYLCSEAQRLMFAGWWHGDRPANEGRSKLAGNMQILDDLNTISLRSRAPGPDLTTSGMHGIASIPDSMASALLAASVP